MNRIAIIGLGVIGASLGLALRDARPHLEILGLDTNPDTLKQALSIGAVSAVSGEWDVSGCDLIIVATPLQALPGVLRSISGSLRPGTMITDVGSVKGRVMDWFRELLPAGVVAVGGHPMAGSEKTGIGAADKHLFENATYILTPGKTCAPEQLAALADLVRATGAQVRVMDADDHDRLVARVSHLPHIAAASLLNALERSSSCLEFAGGGLRDTTRIAASEPQMWTDILSLNREAIIPELDEMIRCLAAYRACLEEDSRTGLLQLLSQAREQRMKVPAARASLKRSADIIAIVPDHPGVIGNIGAILGAEGININDIQIMGVRDEDEGSLRLAVPEESAARALSALINSGVRAWIRP